MGKIARTLGVLTLAMSFSLVATASVNLSVQEGQIREVLRAVASISGRNIVADESVKGSITVQLEDVSFHTALDLITRSSGLTYREIGDVVVVTSYENMQKAFGTVFVQKLQYAKASEVVTALKNIVKGDSLTADSVTNSIIYSGSKGEEEKLRRAIAKLDVATAQITLEAKIIALNFEDSKELGIIWEWSELPEKTNTGLETTDKMGGIIHLGHGYTARFQATLSALLTNGRAKILATPRIITIPGKQASIFIGDHIPVLTEKITNNNTVTTTEYIDAGIKLKYTPILSDDNIITASVHTEVSTPTLISELRNYKVTSRTADTNVRMRQGETLVIGGLINEEEQKTMKSIPFLSKLPILGELFKHRSRSKNKVEVMILLTPYISAPGKSPAIYDPKVKNLRLGPVPNYVEKKEETGKNAPRKN